MLKREVTIKLDGADYTIPAFNIGQLEQLEEMFSTNKAGGMMILKLALSRSTPKVEDWENFSPEMPEVSDAVGVILGMSGIKPPNPPNAPTTATKN